MIKEFKVTYGTSAATQEQLDAIEQITVVQEIGNAWEARIRIPVCIAEDGSWDGEDDPIYQDGERVRVEARIGETGDWIPLIDGTIQERVRDLNAEPGLSSVTVVVNDDIVLLNQREVSASFPAGTSDSDIANQIFLEADLNITPDVEATGTPPDTNAITNQHGTAMAMLQTLVARNRGFKAYVLPGDAPGAPIGCFKRLPSEADDLPALYLTGEDRNLAYFNVSQNSRRAARIRGDHLSTQDFSVSSGDASFSEHVSPDGESATSLSDAMVRQRRLPAATGDHIDSQEAAEGAALASSYTLSAEGSVLPQCYGAILTPYRMVPVRLSNSRFSTDYVIFRVTHTLGRSEYTQSFSLRGNTVSPAAGSSASIPAAAAAVGGAAAVSFNVQIDIF